MRDIPIPNDWDEETDGWHNAVFCVPNSDQWKSVVLGAFQSLTYGRLWERDTGDIRQAQEISNQIVESVQMSCNDQFERIAAALEAIAGNTNEAIEFIDSQYISLSEFIDFLDLAGLEGIQPWLDGLGEILEIFNVIPDLTVKLPINGILSTILGTFQHADFKSRLEHIHWALRAQVLATAGPGVNTVLDALGELVPDPVESVADSILGPVNEVLSTVGIDLSTLLSGNYMTNRVDDVRNALNGGVIPSVGYNVTQKIDQLTASVQAIGLTVIGLGQAGGVDPCGCITVGPDDDEPTDDVVIDEEEDPPPGFDDWDQYRAYKCKVANKIADEIVDLPRRFTSILGGILGLSIGAIIALLAAAISGAGLFFGIIAAALAISAVGLAVFENIVRIGLMTDGAIHLNNWADEMEANEQDIVCTMYNSSSPQAALAAVLSWMNTSAETVAGGISSPDDEEFTTRVATVASNLVNNALINQLFQAGAPLPDDYVGSVDCDTCGQLHDFPWEFAENGGSGTFNYYNQPFTLSSQLTAGVHTLQCLMSDVPDREDYNWCVVFTDRSGMVDAGQNYTRQLYHNANGVDFYAFTDYDTAHTPPGVDSFPPMNQELPISLMFFQNVGSSFTVTMRFVKVVAAVDAPPHTSTACD